MTTFKKYLVFILSFLMMESIIILFPSIANNSSIFYVSVLGAFLGIDMANTLKTTKLLPDGEFKPLHEDRYIFSAISTFLLLVTCIIMQKNQIDLNSTVSILVSGLFSIATLYIASLEGNKFFTGIKQENFDNKEGI